MILSHAVGQRGEYDCIRFLRRLNKATIGGIQVTSDGHGVYTNNVSFEMGSRVDFAQLIKSYSASQVETRYSPATITGIEIVPRFGAPDLEKVSTSYVERFDLRCGSLPTIHAIDECPLKNLPPSFSDDSYVCVLLQLLPETRDTRQDDASNGEWVGESRVEH